MKLLHFIFGCFRYIYTFSTYYDTSVRVCKDCKKIQRSGGTYFMDAPYYDINKIDLTK